VLGLSSGYAKLQRAVLDCIDADWFYVDRRDRSTLGREWFVELLTRFVGSDPGPRSMAAARSEWWAWTTVLLGMVANGDSFRFQSAKLGPSLRVVLASSDEERISDWLLGLKEEDLASLSFLGYMFMPSVLASMAIQAKLPGSSSEEKPFSYCTWRCGSVILEEQHREEIWLLVRRDDSCGVSQN